MCCVNLRLCGCVLLALVMEGAMPVWVGAAGIESPHVVRDGATPSAGPRARRPFKGVQVNVDRFGQNIPGDAANQPSIAVDPSEPNRMVITWRHYEDAKTSGAVTGWATTRDGGRTWRFEGVMDPNAPEIDSVVVSNRRGGFYNAGSQSRAQFRRSRDAGATWTGQRVTEYFKPWLAIDPTDGIGNGNIYLVGNPQNGQDRREFTRSTDGGRSFMSPLDLPSRIKAAMMSVDPDGDLFLINSTFEVLRSTDAKDPDVRPSFAILTDFPLFADPQFGESPNPRGLRGRNWIVTDHSQGDRRGNVYALMTANTTDEGPRDILFARSTDGGITWSDFVRVNDDPRRLGAEHWFGMLSIAPNGRLDAVWNDTRGSGQINISELYYSHSEDGGDTWSTNIPISPPFDSLVGRPASFPNLGNYYTMLSDNLGVHIAFAATFNGEQDVYYLRIGDYDCNRNNVADGIDIAEGTSDDCDLNETPDECDPDCNRNTFPDSCDIADGRSSDEDGDGFPDECAVAFVDADAAGAENGLCWGDAFTDLQDALRKAGRERGAIREIWVADGVYKPAEPDEDRRFSFNLMNDVALYGGFVGNEERREDRDPDPESNSTILSGDLNGNDGPYFSHREDNSHHVVSAQVIDPSAVLDGFTITGGQADGDLFRYACGGGLSARFASPTLDHILFEGNHASDSGGGARFIAGDSIVLTDCTFRQNIARFSGGALQISAHDAGIIGCTFQGNRAQKGGGLYLVITPTHLVNCTFLGNTAVDVGGALYAGDSVVGIANTVFLGNTATDSGGAIQVFRDRDRDSVLQLAGATLSGNASPQGASIATDSRSQSFPSVVEINNSILFNEAASEIWNNDDSDITVSFSDVFGGWDGPGEGNISDDPSIVDLDGPDGMLGTEDDNARLAGGSPALDRGDNDAIPPDWADLDGDGDTEEPIPFDLDGHERVLDGTVDMGAYEGPHQAIFTSTQAVLVPEGGTAEFSVLLALPPGGESEVSVSVLQGDADIVIESGQRLLFNDANFDQPQSVVLRAEEDIDLANGRAVVRAAAADVGPADVLVREIDNEPMPNVLFVNQNAQGLNVGSNWTDALVELRDATEVAKDRGGVREIWVATGTYTPAVRGGDRLLSFDLPSGVRLLGGFAGRETRRDQRDPVHNITILSGDLNGDDDSGGTNDENSIHIITAVDLAETTTIDGFRITGGNANDPGPNINKRNGAGLFSRNAEVVVSASVFDRNSAGRDGGGIFTRDGNLAVRGCTFSHNHGGSTGSAITSFFSTLTVTRCQFIANTVWNWGTVANLGGPLQVVDCLFAGNVAQHSASGINNSNNPDVLVSGCTFFANQATDKPGLISTQAGHEETLITDCILWGNGPDPLHIRDGFLNVSYSIIEGGWPGEGNKDIDPLFVDPIGPDGLPGTADDDLRLASESPAIDAGDPDFVPAPGERDLDGHARVLCDRVDMGAYEFGIGDYECDRDVDLDDYRFWTDCVTGPGGGPYPDGCEALDFDFDGDVDLRDFSRFANAFPR